MSEHTPGPWFVDPNQANQAWTDSIAICHDDGVAVPPVIAHTTRGWKPGEAEANARLIAACPTMFDFIKSRADKGDEDAAKIIASIRESK